MIKTSDWQIANIRTNERHPGIIYAEVIDVLEEDTICSATLDYCVKKVIAHIKETPK